MNATEESAVASSTDKKPLSQGISLDDTIALFEAMVPSKEVEMRREMEKMFPSIIGALERDVCAEQIVATLRQKWPGARAANIVKVLNAERARRLEHGEHVNCKPFGLPHKPKMRKAAMTGTSGNSAQMPHASPDTPNSDQLEVSA
jgi:hypothetical protein